MRIALITSLLGGPVGSGDTAKLLLRSVRYVKSYDELAFGGRPHNVEDSIDHGSDRPILIAYTRSEMLQLGKFYRRPHPSTG